MKRTHFGNTETRATNNKTNFPSSKYMETIIWTLKFDFKIIWANLGAIWPHVAPYDPRNSQKQAEMQNQMDITNEFPVLKIHKNYNMNLG